MRLGRRGKEEIVWHEGVATSPYRDTKGVWTVGVGHTAAAGDPDPSKGKRQYTLAEVMEIFERDIRECEKRVSEAFTRPLTQEQFDAAVSFDFNTGAINRALWVTHFNKGDDATAADAFMAWRRPPEIIRRRQRERDLFFKGTYACDGSVGVYEVGDGGTVRPSKRVPVAELWHPPSTPPPLATPRRRREGSPVPGSVLAAALAVVGMIVMWIIATFMSVMNWIGGWF